MMNNINAKALKEMLISGANNLQNNKELVDKLNVFPVPDGDTGTNMSLTIASAIKELNKVSDEDITSIGKSIAKGSLMGARGNSGVILSQIIRGFAKGIENKNELTSEDLANAFKLGSDTAYKAVIKPIEGTILTVVRESADFAINNVKKDQNVIEFLESIIYEANLSLERTPELLPALKNAGVVDSGGKGLIIFYEGMLESLKGNFIDRDNNVDTKESVEVNTMEYIDPVDIKFGYCTEFILETDKITPEKIRDLMLPLGDSLAVVGDEGIIKVHVHTNEPGTAIQKALEYGQLVAVKIENMRLQHENLLVDNQAPQIEEEKEYSIIATSVGEGLNTLFKDLRVDHIIEGGQTMNPSTQDFLDAINKINARNIIIFPNNSNIIMSANQAKELSEKNIVVIPTKTIPQCVSALINFDEELTIEENEQVMLDAIQQVGSGQITYAVRNTNMDGIEIKEGNYIGISNGKMSSASEKIDEVVLETLSKLIKNESYLITLYYGQDIKEDDAEELRDKIASVYEEVDVEIIYGGQPVYYYLLSVE